VFNFWNDIHHSPLTAPRHFYAAKFQQLNVLQYMAGYITLRIAIWQLMRENNHYWPQGYNVELCFLPVKI